MIACGYEDSSREAKRPLATVVIGGLISSTVLTLIALPVFYLWIEQWDARRNRALPKPASDGSRLPSLVRGDA